MTKRTHEQYIELLNSKFGYIIPLEKYTNSQTKLPHKCLKCGYIWSPVPNRLLGATNRGCPKCSKKERNKEATKTTEQYREELAKVRCDFVCVGEYIGANVETLHQCLKCGSQFMCTPHTMLRGKVCPQCSMEINTTEKYRELLKERRPDMEVLEEFRGKRIKILHRHSCGYEYMISPNHVLQHKGGCEGCYRQLRRKSEQEFLEQTKNSPLNIVGKYQGANHKVKVECPNGHISYVYPSNLIKGFGCGKCAQSGGEIRIKKYLEKNNINFIEQMKFDDLRDIKKLSYDFYLPDYNLLIEFQGKQHIKASSNFGGPKQLKIQQRHDQIKEEYANNNGYKILYIWYYEQDEIETILDKCLKSKSVETAG